VSHLKFAKEFLWKERNWAGKIVFSILWPFALIGAVVNDGMDWLEKATKKNK